MATAQLALHDVTKRYDTRLVLDQVTVTVRPGEKVGVVGDNGSGKSTLLALMAGAVSPDDGTVTVTAPGGVGHLPQTLSLPATATVRDAVDLSLGDLRDLEARLHRAEADLARADEPELAATMAHYTTLVSRYEARGGYTADRRVATALDALGLPGLDRERVLGTLSGGERSRLALAGTLAAEPELLLLDEPTNDLDDSAVEWLEERLREHRGTVVAVTHDRLFLERLTSTILEVDAGSVNRYGGGYDGYVAAKAAERHRRLVEYELWRAELARNEQLVERNAARLGAIPRKLPLAGFGSGAFRARGRGHGAMGRIRSAKERIERLTGSPVPRPPDPLVLTADITAPGARRDQDADLAGDAADIGTPSPDGDRWAVCLDGVRVTDRLSIPHLRLAPGERLLVTGPNGAGKSTLLQVLAGELEPDRGTVHAPERVGYLRQQEPAWPSRLTVLHAFAAGRDGDLEERAEQLLSLGLFRPAELPRRIDDLSYGQRRRVELARLVSEPVDLVLLDEPTNHLSPALVEELEEALESYTGTLVVVTHDRRMRSRFAGSRVALRDGAVEHR